MTRALKLKRRINGNVDQNYEIQTERWSETLVFQYNQMNFSKNYCRERKEITYGTRQ